MPTSSTIRPPCPACCTGSKTAPTWPSAAATSRAARSRRGRGTGGSIPAWSWHRRALSRYGNRYAAFVLGLPVTDATSGYRAYHANALRLLDTSAFRADGYGFQIETAYRVHRAGGRIVEVPIAFHDRVAGTSKMSWRIVLEALVLVTWWACRERLVPRIVIRYRDRRRRGSAAAARPAPEVPPDQPPAP